MTGGVTGGVTGVVVLVVFVPFFFPLNIFRRIAKIPFRVSDALIELICLRIALISWSEVMF